MSSQSAPRCEDRRPSVLLLVPQMDIGGAERQLTTLVPHLDRTMDLRMLALGDAGALDGRVGARLASEYRPSKKRHAQALFGFVRRLLVEIRRRRPDVIYSYMIECNVLAALLKPVLSGTRLIWGVRNSDMHWGAYGPVAEILCRLEILLSRCSDLVIFNSHAGLRHHVSRGFKARRMAVIHNGIDTERFAPDPGARRDLRQEWGIRPDEILVGLVARLDPMKDHPTFLRAAGLLKEEKRSLRFVCIGGGKRDYEQSLRSAAQDMGLGELLIWAGSRDDSPRFQNALDIACSSSAWGEGCSNAIAEAMSCGVPAVVTDVGDSAMIVGDTGMVVPARSPVELAKGVLRLLGSLNRERQLRCRDRILRQFGVPVMVAKTRAALEFDLHPTIPHPDFQENAGG